MSVLKIQAHRQVFSTGGRLTKFKSHKAMLRKVAANHAKLEKDFSDKVTVFVAGVRAGSKIIPAMTHGVVVITEDQFVELLEQGEIEIQTREVEKNLDLESMIGDLRSLLSQPATTAAWTTLVGMLEKCDEDRLPEVVAYLSHQLADWGQDVRWKIRKNNALIKDFVPPQWTRSTPTTQLCVAPPLWLIEALRGQVSERHKLVRALNLEGLQLDGDLGLTLIQHEGWHDIRALVLGGTNTFSREFYTYLAQSDMMQTLEELWVCQYTPAETFAGENLNEDSFPMLRRVVVDAPYHDYPGEDARTEFLTTVKDETPWISSAVNVDPWPS